MYCTVVNYILYENEREKETTTRLSTVDSDERVASVTHGSRPPRTIRHLMHETLSTDAGDDDNGDGDDEAHIYNNAPFSKLTRQKKKKKKKKNYIDFLRWESSPATHTHTQSTGREADGNLISCTINFPFIFSSSPKPRAKR